MPETLTSTTESTATEQQEQHEAVQEGQARELLRNLADFRETMVREVMTPRPDIIGIENTATVDQLLTLFREQQYSRLPVFNETLDNVVGILFIKDLLQQLRPGPGLTGPIAPFIRPAHFVPDQRVPIFERGPRTAADCGGRLRVRRHRGTCEVEVCSRTSANFATNTTYVERTSRGPGQFLLSVIVR